ncbi:MAG TPA: sigma-70 family RNA polymerase sigma factor [Bacteroidota bacterium]|nr:sigma-70 family RNA polymerase sigma factor [Bacteroidota bacterium]
MDIQDLPEKLRSHDQAAFRQLVEQYGTRVANTCFGFLKNKQDAEDTAQDVFIEVYRSIGEFRGESQLSTWIYRIAVTKSLNVIKARNRKKRIGLFKHVLGLEEVMQDAKAPDELNPDVQVEEKERMALLLETIAGLPENQRVALTLHRLEGFSHDEVAAILQTSVPSVESLIFRAKRNLEKRLFRHFKKKLSKQTDN